MPFRNQFELVVEASPNAMVLANDAGRIVYVNVQTEQLFGYSRDELLGQSVEMLVPEQFRRNHPVLRESFMEMPVARPMGVGRHLYGRHKDGSELPIEIGLNPLVTDEGTFVLAAIVNIAERKRLEELRLLNAGMQQHSEELETLNRQLEIASRLKSQFVATMSHELRTPLNAIIGMAELLSKADLDERLRVHVRTIYESAEGLLAIINSILDFSKIEAGKMDLHPIAFAFESVVEAAADVLALEAREKGIRLSIHVDPAIPPLQGDVDRLRQILINLIGNAVKFTERGEVLVRALPLEMHERDVTLRVEVQDSGIGIASDVLAQLFEPFVQGDGSASRRFGGTGLGLSISKRLVELMGGEIGVESEFGSGTLFWFTARFVRAGAADAPKTPRGVSGVPAFTETDGPILVAEDDVRLQRLLKLQFDDLARPVTFVPDGQEVVDALRRANYAMVFMDCQMPNVDGLTATRMIRNEEARTGRHVPIVAMTANAFAEDREACLAAGMDDYLAKPVKLGDLRAKIERWSKKSRRSTQDSSGGTDPAEKRKK